MPDAARRTGFSLEDAVLDIGGDIGALILYTDAGYVGREIELSLLEEADPGQLDTAMSTRPPARTGMSTNPPMGTGTATTMYTSTVPTTCRSTVPSRGPAMRMGLSIGSTPRSTSAGRVAQSPTPGSIPSCERARTRSGSTTRPSRIRSQSSAAKWPSSTGGPSPAQVRAGRRSSEPGQPGCAGCMDTASTAAWIRWVEPPGGAPAAADSCPAGRPLALGDVLEGVQTAVMPWLVLMVPMQPASSSTSRGLSGIGDQANLDRRT